MQLRFEIRTLYLRLMSKAAEFRRAYLLNAISFLRKVIV
jgi:hypothetical protein